MAKRYIVQGYWNSGRPTSSDTFETLVGARKEVRWLLGIDAIDHVTVHHQDITTTKITSHSRRKKGR